MPKSAMSNRALTPSEQLRVLTRVWGVRRDGYVFMPWIAGTATNKEQRRKNYHEGRAYEWPRERPAILDHLQAHLSDDMYFCPNLFNGKRRVEELADAERTLWADLDAVDPRKLGDLRPTIAWESSPNRYQGIWILDRMRHGASWAGKENQRLTYAIGADPSGWDSTQLLRVPGRANHKPEYRAANDGREVAGRLLWSNGPAYTWEDFDDLPEIGSIDQSDMDLMDEEFLSGIDRHALWGRVRLRVSPNVRQHMSIRHEHQMGDADRSDVLWEIERELADAGCTLAEIVALVRPTVWNKYIGRNDELKRLKTEAAKAIAAITTDASGGAVEVIEAVKPKNVTWLADVAAMGVKRPRWLINNVWAEGGCGFIAGAPKSYKSYFAIDMALSLALGGKFLNHPSFGIRGGPRKVLYLQEEDSQSLVMERMEQVIEGKFPTAHWYGYLNNDPTNVDAVMWNPPTHNIPIALHVKSGFVASDESWQSWLDEMLAEHKFSAVFVDTLSTTAGHVDTDKANDLMNRILKPMRELSTKHNAAIIFIHHNRKDAGNGKINGNATDHLSDRAGRDMLGSTQLHAWVDCALYVRTKSDLKRVIGITTEAGQPVPGVELYVEREAKLAEETKWRISIPRMSHDDTGVDHWTPSLQRGWSTPDDESAQPVKNTARPTQRGPQLTLSKLIGMGMTTERGRSIEHIISVTSETPPDTLRKHMEILSTNGSITESNGQWFTT